MELVTAPDGGRHARHRGQHATGIFDIRAQTARARGRLGDVRDDATAPATDLIPEHSQAARPAGANRATGDNAAAGGIAARYGRLLNRIAPFRHADDERLAK